MFEKFGIREDFVLTGVYRKGWVYRRKTSSDTKYSQTISLISQPFAINHKMRK
jgi:hypothetical protein